jgi:DNA-binding response OmpR family regulator
MHAVCPKCGAEIVVLLFTDDAAGGSLASEPGVPLTDTLFFDPDRLRLRTSEYSVQLKGIEAHLFLYLFQHRGSVLTRAEIFEAVWAERDSYGHELDVYISRLRGKLRNLANADEIIVTVQGFGYILEPRIPHAKLNSS